MSEKTMSDLKILKVWYETFCDRADELEKSYNKHSEKLNEIVNMIEEVTEDTQISEELSKEIKKLRKLQQIDLKLAKDLVCMYKKA
jgi:hypothetical protein